jgi:probable rRNA maturation factor
MICFDELVDFDNPIDLKLVESLVIDIVNDYNKNLDCINFIFCSDDYLLDINQRYLNHDYYTDVVTFDYDVEFVTSDVFISIDRVRDNGVMLHVPFKMELLRVVIHAVLHLCGISDKTTDEEVEMRLIENHYVQVYVSRET